MGLIDDVRLIRWKETLWYNALRSIAAGIVWTALMLIFDDGQMEMLHARATAQLLVMPFMLAMMLIPITLFFRLLAYIPLVGLFFGLLALVMMGVGDPLIYALHKAKPEWVPVDYPSFFSPNGFIFVMSPYKEF